MSESSPSHAHPDHPHPHGPHYYGGQAVIEGVMMRGSDCWAVAVRRPDDTIYLERHTLSTVPKRHPWLTKPLIRGTWALVDALTIGTRALTISANQSVDESEQLSSKQMGGSLLLALALFIGVFIVLPNLGLAALHERIGSETLYHLIEGVVRIGIFLAYLFGISLMADIKRVFQYHGAEHRTIHAWEHGRTLTQSNTREYGTEHVRCGTNFLVMVMLIAVFVYSIAGAIYPTPEGGLVVTATYHILLRIALLPVVAGLAYEGLRIGARFDNWFVRGLMRPGIWLQKITTRDGDEQMAEVAIRAFEAVVPRDELTGRTTDLPSRVVWGPDDLADAEDARGLPKPPGSVLVADPEVDAATPDPVEPDADR